MSELEPMKGQCLCAAIQFEIQGPTDFVAHCHCRSCRLSRGVAFVTWTGVPRDRFRFVRGESNVSWYRSSESILWGFCKTCGSSIFYQADRPGHPEAPKLDRMYVSVGSLTSPIDKMPTAHVSYEEHVAWIEGSHALPKYRGKSEAEIT